MDGPVLEGEDAEARSLGDVTRHVGAAGARHLLDDRREATLEERLQLLLRGGGLKVEVEVASLRGRPRKAPPHPLSVGEELLERRAGDAGERRVARVEMRNGAVEG